MVLLKPLLFKRVREIWITILWCRSRQMLKLSKIILLSNEKLSRQISFCQETCN